VSDLPAPVSRLSPCPCGSGKRYKDCHGALTVTPRDAPAAPARRSAYRPTGPEWNLLSESERDRLGVAMEAALVHQRDGRARDAERHYREVLAVAPATHDALHMLAMARWSEGDYVEARRLIEAALPLRPEYPAIRQNLSLVLSAQRAQERSAQEALCEKALPRMFELLRASHAESPAAPVADDVAVHLIGNDDGSDSDDAWMLRRLAAVVGAERAVIWPAQREAFAPGADDDGAPRPVGGVHIWVGVDIDVASTLPRVPPGRTVVFAQSASPSRWLEVLRAIGADGARPLELVVESQPKADRFGTGHAVLPPPIDLAEFAAAEGSPRRGDPEEFVVGNVAQDGRMIPHARAGSLQERVANAGLRLDVYDPGRVRYALGAMPNVKCLSRRDVTLAQFLAPLSCYLYCCDAWWKEGLGRDLYGAMALGIPVLLPRTSIHAAHVRDGVDGILYDDDAGALESIKALREDPARRSALGSAARDRARCLFDPDGLALAYRRLIAGA